MIVEKSGKELDVHDTIVSRSVPPWRAVVTEIDDAGMTLLKEDGEILSHDFFLGGPRWFQKFLVQVPDPKK